MIGFMDTKEVAKVLGVSRQTLQKYIQTGELQAVAIGHRHHIKPEWLDQFIESRAVLRQKRNKYKPL